MRRVGLVVFLFPVFLLSMNACAVFLVPTYTVDIRVIDQEGEPVEGAYVHGGFGTGSPDYAPNLRRSTGLTDRNGKLRVSGPSLGRVDFYIEKSGFYRSTKRMQVEGQKRHQIEIVLRDIRNPIPMYTRKASLLPPSSGQKYGYDFFVGDWVHEGHKGQEAHIFVEGDIVFIQEDLGHPRYEIELEAEISFPNELDGFQFVKPVTGAAESAFKSMYEAPENGYQDHLSVSWSRRLDTGYSGVNVDRPLYLRIRSRIDEEGNLQSANYCKVFPGLTVIRTAERVGVAMTYYCNPIANDRNVEFDRKRNLFTDYQSMQNIKP